jgi:hypothetical protein
MLFFLHHSWGISQLNLLYYFMVLLQGRG